MCFGIGRTDKVGTFCRKTALPRSCLQSAFFLGYITDVAIDADGRYFVTAESDERILFWNFKSRVVLHKESQTDVVQIEILEGDPDTIIVVSKAKCNKTGGDIYR